MTPRHHPHRLAHNPPRTAWIIAVCTLAACSAGGDAVGTTVADTVTVTVPTATNVVPETVPAATVPAATVPAVNLPTDTASLPAETVAAPATLDPLDDLDEDGSFDERCGTTDLGGGLVVDTLCNTALAPTPENGVVPTAGSLLLLPSPSRWDDLADVDATVRVATTADGRRVAIYVLGSDTLFDSGSAALRPTAASPIEAIVASILTRFPAASVDVRGAADSVGEPAANQALSEQRAATVAAELLASGITAAVTWQGLGESVPVAAETNADGSVNDVGRQVNRRVEIVVG